MTQITRERVKAWCIAAIVRAIRTAAQAAVSLIGTNALGITEVDWVAVASAAALAAVVSVLMALAGLPEVEEGDDLPTLMQIHGEHIKEE